MKKTTRKFAAFIAAMTLTACAMAPMSMVSYAAETTTITISDAETNSQYSAFKLFDAVQTGDTFSYTINSNYAEALKEVTGKETEADILNYIAALEGDADATRAFADAVYAKIKLTSAEYTIVGSEKTTVVQGYYLIAETTLGSTEDTESDDSYSLVILNTAGAEGLTVTTKEDEPTLVKKVKDINDSTETELGNWQDSADHDFTDTVPFQLTGTVSEKIGNYKEYYYSFHDTLSSGLTFDENSVKVYLNDVNTTIDSQYYEVVTSGSTFEVQFYDLKKVPNVDASSKIIVEYNATLNTGAVIGSAGNPNVASLEYSTNPYFVGGGTEGKDEGEDTGYTPEDKVIVFTYQVDVNKKDQSGNALAGAEFKLYKATSVTDDGAGNITYEWAETALTPEVDAETGAIFSFKGIDDGVYKLEESKTPGENYKAIEDIIFTVTAAHEELDDDPSLTAFSGTAEDGHVLTPTNGILSTDVINTFSSTLPSTGGIGTTLFVAGGSCLVALSGVYLISKKRAKNESAE